MSSSSEPARTVEARGRACAACDDAGASWWDCPHGAAQPSARVEPWLRGFWIGAVAAIVTAAVLAVWRWARGEG